MSIILTRDMRRALERENAKWPKRLMEVPRDEWPAYQSGKYIEPEFVWRSRDYLVVQYAAPNPAICRLSIQRTHRDGERWEDGITWDDLQRLKGEAGFANKWAVEIFPDDREIVNVANMRHLWLLPFAPEYAWIEKDFA